MDEVKEVYTVRVTTETDYRVEATSEEAALENWEEAEAYEPEVTNTEVVS